MFSVDDLELFKPLLVLLFGWLLFVCLTDWLLSNPTDDDD